MLRFAPWMVGLWLVACTPPVIGGPPPQRECIPDWPEECLGAEETTGSDPDAPFTCSDPVDLEEGQRAVYSCLPVPGDGECPEPDSECVAEAFENRFVVDCRDCLRETLEIECGPDPDVADACCYRTIITSPDQDEC